MFRILQPILSHRACFLTGSYPVHWEKTWKAITKRSIRSMSAFLDKSFPSEPWNHTRLNHWSPTVIAVKLGNYLIFSRKPGNDFGQAYPVERNRTSVRNTVSPLHSFCDQIPFFLAVVRTLSSMEWISMTLSILIGLDDRVWSFVEAAEASYSDSKCSCYDLCKTSYRTEATWKWKSDSPRGSCWRKLSRRGHWYRSNSAFSTLSLKSRPKFREAAQTDEWQEQHDKSRQIEQVRPEVHGEIRHSWYHLLNRGKDSLRKSDRQRQGWNG